MSVKSKQIINDDGSKATVLISSDDNRELRLNGSYCLANRKTRKENVLVKKFKGSILGADIGFKSSGFTSVAILATIVAVSAILIMYFMWRF